MDLMMNQMWIEYKLCPGNEMPQNISVAQMIQPADLSISCFTYQIFATRSYVFERSHVEASVGAFPFARVKEEGRTVSRALEQWADGERTLIGNAR